MEKAWFYCEKCGPDAPIFLDELGPKVDVRIGDGKIIQAIATHNCGGALICDTDEDREVIVAG